MALDKQLWLKTIQEQLFKDDSFLNVVGQDHSDYVQNITVHIPQAGSNPTVSKNLTTFPASVGTRSDVDLTYNIDLYYSQPIRVGVDETQYISYDKRASVLSSHMKKMRNVMGNNTLYQWAPSGASRIVRTSGATSTLALAPGASGSRKVPTLADFRKVRAKLGMDNLNPSDTIYGIVPEEMYWDLIGDTNISKFLEWGESAVAPSGKVAKVAGISLLHRSSVLVYDNTATPVIKSVNDEGTPSSTATTDNMAILCVSESYVSKALGQIQVFQEEKSPTYYGDIMSIVVAQGGSKMRTNQEGIVALIQEA